MQSVLDSFEWGKPALSLLSQCPKLDANLPAVMHIRHTERSKGNQESYEYAQKTGSSMLLSTKKGKQAAFEFGERLPGNRNYRVFHSSVDRARETAERVHQGLLSKGTESRLKGIFMNVDYNRDATLNYIKRDVRDVDAPNARPYFINHVSNHYPPEEVEPGVSIAKRNAKTVMKNLESATPESFDIYVSHDIFCALFLLYWFGIMPDERWIEFMDGFIMQLSEKMLHVWTKDGKKEAYYPYWWNI